MREAATANGRIDDADIRQRLMRFYTKIQILKINGLRNLTSTLNKSKDRGTVALGATNKMFWSEMHQEAMELALDIFGADVDADRHRSRDAARGRARAATSAVRAIRSAR